MNKSMSISIFLAAAIYAGTAFPEEITEIKYNDGADKYESEAIAFALSDEIADDVKYYLEVSHFYYGPSCSGEIADCRQHFEFELRFGTASVDLNLDAVDEVIVEYSGVNVCGAGGCSSYILQQDKGSWFVIGTFFPSNKVQISSNMTNGHFDIYYFGRTEKYVCKFDKAAYDC